MSGYNGGLSVLGIGLKKPSKGGKLTSRLFTGMSGSINVPVPAWPKYVLLEALGPGGNQSSGLGGGGWADDVICRIVNRDDPISVVVNASNGNTHTHTVLTYKVTGASKELYGIRGTYSTNNNVQGDALQTTPRNYGKFLGGITDNASGTSKDAEYGSRESVTYGYTKYTGGGRLATFCQPALSLAHGLGQGMAPSSDTSVGYGAACVTFAEDIDQLITFLNAHYLDLWGVDWRTIAPSLQTKELYL